VNAPGMLICLAGVSGAGKDTVGAYLQEHGGFTRIAVADALKRAMMQLFGLTEAQLWGDARNDPDPRLGRTPRAMYQEFGEACMRIDPQVWLRPFRAQVEASLREGRDVVCTDLRTADELRVAKEELGGRIWLLTRSSAGAPGEMALHRTERELSEAPRHVFDEVIENDGSLAELHSRIERARAAHHAARIS
jgi:hypothetical protein